MGLCEYADRPRGPRCKRRAPAHAPFATSTEASPGQPVDPARRRLGVLALVLLIAGLLAAPQILGPSSNNACLGGGAPHGPTTTIAAPAPPSPTEGYSLIDAAGNLYGFGDQASYTTSTSLSSDQPVVGIAYNRVTHGIWVLESNGTVLGLHNGTTEFQPDGTPDSAPAAAIAANPTGNGYLIARTDGTFSFYGNTGSTSDVDTNAAGYINPVGGAAISNNGSGGYLIMSQNGGDWCLINCPPNGLAYGYTLVGVASDASGNGYWIATSGGGIICTGDATTQYGSLTGKPLSAPIVGIAQTPDGDGYWMVGADGVCLLIRRRQVLRRAE